ncbi:hypothetical protein MYP_2356 [Sporocytophaga myxococcoides]|uniref:Lipoprotein n=1 Tax=Sporocytophaga myxococcoides TaxID=153721 RepID=A0A098LGA9_9BACT|nr:hypothetical protein [Sporocytophaga myxococcoides]GAL85128.1 hypothetical protein MYP_2356 [Sporocytophaga myxococcoides]
MMKKLFFIVSLSILFASCSRQTTTFFFQDAIIPDNSNLDSIRIINFINNLKLDFVSGDIDTSSIIDWDSVNEVLYMQQTTCCDGRVVYSPDSLFKIYVILGQSCGGYCNPFWESHVYSKLGNKLLMKVDSPFNYITDIYKLHDNKYLIFQEEFYRAASVLSVSCRTALIVSIKHDSLIFYPVIKDVTDDNFSKDFQFDNNSFTFCQEHNISEEPELTFDTLISTLYYRFGRNYAYCCELDSDSLITGSLIYDNGEFKKLNHEVKFIETEE